ncbi:sensor histidine kinase [Thermosulfuriphilus sp.]
MGFLPKPRFWLGLSLGVLVLSTLAYLWVLRHDLEVHQRLDARAIHQLITNRLLGHLELANMLPPSAPSYLRSLTWLTDELQGQPFLYGVMVWGDKGIFFNSFPGGRGPFDQRPECPFEREVGGIFYLCQSITLWPDKELFVLVGVEQSFKQEVWREGLVHGGIILGGGILVLLGVGLYLERLQRRSELLEARLAENQKLATVGKMASLLAHEIRNPLNTLSMGIQMLRELGGVRPEILERMDREVRRLETLAGEFLSLARGIRVRPCLVRLKDLLASFLPALILLAEMKRIKLRVYLPDGEGALEADPRWLSRALENLLRNALEATPEGGEVSLRIYLEAEDMVFMIQDNGPGIAPEDRKRIFDPFFSRKPDGFGLGLFIVERVIQAHGGSIDLESQPGRGALFRVRIPRKGSGNG